MQGRCGVLECLRVDSSFLSSIRTNPGKHLRNYWQCFKNSQSTALWVLRKRPKGKLMHEDISKLCQKIISAISSQVRFAGESLQSQHSTFDEGGQVFHLVCSGFLGFRSLELRVYGLGCKGVHGAGSDVFGIFRAGHIHILPPLLTTVPTMECDRFLPVLCSYKQQQRLLSGLHCDSNRLRRPASFPLVPLLIRRILKLTASFSHSGVSREQRHECPSIGWLAC